MQYIEFTWDSVDAAVSYLSSIKEWDEVDLVVGIEYGGIIPAALVHRFCPRAGFTTINPMMPPSEVHGRIIGHKRILLVDDINDSGDTFMTLAGMMGSLFGALNEPAFSCMSLIKRRQTRCQWAISGITVDHEDWFVFPWETKEGEKEKHEERDRGV